MHKQFFLLTALVLAAAAGLTAAAQMSPGERSDHSGRILQRMTAELNLTDSQQTRIKTILDTEKAKIQPLRQQLRQNRSAQTSNTGTFDEAQVRAYAVKQAQLRADLTVERERTKSQIYAVLTPEQRDKARSLLQQHSHHMHRRSQFPANTTHG
jgi:protein CpxP